LGKFCLFHKKKHRCLNERCCRDAVLYYSHRRTSRQDTLKKLTELQKNIDGWENKDTGQSCNEFVLGTQTNGFSNFLALK
jgi:son of sevenless-like protein